MKKYHIITIGCQMNKADSERLAGALSVAGWRDTERPENAGLIVVNTCGVRQSAEDRAYGLVPKLRVANKRAKIVLTGCLAYREDVKKRIGDLAEFMSIGELIMQINTQHEIRTGKVVPILSHPTPPSPRAGEENLLRIIGDNCSYLSTRPMSKDKVTAYVPIGNGCDNFCAYCVVPYARGRETWRSAEEIIAEVKVLVECGYKEIVLIAQNVNSYYSISNSKFLISKRTGRSKIDFADLLRMVCGVEGEFWVRFATSHPKDMSVKLIRTIARESKVCEQVHLPVQAGSDAVLRAMNRRYTNKHYNSLVERIRKEFARVRPVGKGLDGTWQAPVAITTDLIVGFPGETRTNFADSAALCRRIGFDQIFVARYSPRPGTAAAKLRDNVAREEKSRREQAIRAIVSRTSLKNNRKYVGKVVSVLVTGRGRKGEWRGRTRTDKAVRLTGRGIKAGSFYRVKISAASDFGLEGVV